MATATPLERYQEELSRVVTLLDALPQWKKVESHDEYTRRAAFVVQQVREALLPIGSVEWNGNTFMLDNKWLVETLARYDQIPVADEARREAEVAQLGDRLKAIKEQLTKLSGATKVSGNDEDKKRLDEILKRPEFTDQKDEESALAKLWRRFLQWLNELLPRGKGLAPGASGVLGGFAQIIVISLALAIIAYVFWKFAPVFRRNFLSSKGEKREARIVLGERLEADQTSADLLAEAEALARAGNLRAAIRKGYIALLCELGDRKIIGLAQHKTNRDYLRAVRQIEPLHQQMQQLTQSFENHWYGFVPATETDWNAFRSGFQRIASNE
jgi:hypothetical protein